jgi:hypothetical protein
MAARLTSTHLAEGQAVTTAEMPDLFCGRLDTPR